MNSGAVTSSTLFFFINVAGVSPPSQGGSFSNVCFLVIGLYSAELLPQEIHTRPVTNKNLEAFDCVHQVQFPFSGA